MKYVVKDLKEIAGLLNDRAANEKRIGEIVGKHSKAAGAAHMTRAQAFAEAATIVSETEIED